MALFELMIDGTWVVFLLAASAAVLFFSLVVSSSASYAAPPFIFSEEPYTATIPLGEVPPHFFLLPSRDGFVYCAID